MSDARLRALVQDLSAQGIDVGELPELQLELDALEEPTGLIDRVSQRAVAFARTHWERLMGELQESRDAGALLTRRLRGEELADVDQARLQAQLGDVVRMVPASLLTLAIEAVPVPGTSVVTPWLLMRLGLMPSQWREAHLLSRLQAESARLRAQQQDAAADRIDALRATLTAEAERRAIEQLDADLHVHWDSDGDGHWDRDETAAYGTAMQDMVERMAQDAWHRMWFLCHRGTVFGPVRVAELRQASPTAPLLVTHEEVDGWVVLQQLLDETQGSVDG